MKRSLSLLSGFVLLFLVACGGTTSNNNSDAGSDAGSSADSQLCSVAGCVGATCSADSDCTEGSGGTAVCWQATLLNQPKLVTTPGGYCSRDCQSDADCGTAKCVSLPSTNTKYCMARCSSASRCRKPGFSCAFDGDNGGICFPSANFDCNPANGDGQCEYGTTKNLGGCVRVAFESAAGGVCHYQCQVGQSTCPVDNRATGSSPPQQCIYYNSTVDSNGTPNPLGDKFKGNLCFDQAQPQTPDLAPCKYWSECLDGRQCDRYNAAATAQVCRPLCVLVKPGETFDPAQRAAGLVSPSGAVPATNACTSPTDVCSNAFRTNLATGVSGLCQPKM